MSVDPRLFISDKEMKKENKTFEIDKWIVKALDQLPRDVQNNLVNYALTKTILKDVKQK